MKVFSYSRIGAFESCPKKFAFRYIDDAHVEGEGIEAFMGKRAHETLEHLYREAHVGRLISEPDCLAYFDAAWDKAFTEAVRIVAAGATAQDYRDNGRLDLQRYYRRHAPFTQRRLLAVEQHIDVPLSEHRNLMLQGYVDRIDEVAPGELQIHDYKTSRRLPPQSAMDADRQLAIYELGVRRLFPETRTVTLVWHYLRFDREIRSQRTAARLEGSTVDAANFCHPLRVHSRTTAQPRGTPKLYSGSDDENNWIQLHRG